MLIENHIFIQIETLLRLSAKYYSDDMGRRISHSHDLHPKIMEGLDLLRIASLLEYIKPYYLVGSNWAFTSDENGVYMGDTKVPGFIDYVFYLEKQILVHTSGWSERLVYKLDNFNRLFLFTDPNITMSKTVSSWNDVEIADIKSMECNEISFSQYVERLLGNI